MDAPLDPVVHRLRPLLEACAATADLSEVLADVLEFSGAERVFLLLPDAGDAGWRLAAQQARTGLGRALAAPSALPAAMRGPIVMALRHGQCVVLESSELGPPEAGRAFDAPSAGTGVLLVPALRDDAFIGCLGFEGLPIEQPAGAGGRATVLQTAAAALAAASAREQARQAQKQTQQMVRAHAALQQLIDATVRIARMDSFLPAAIDIVCRAFDAVAAGYWEHPDEIIRVRFWMLGGTAVAPDDLPGLPEAQRETLRLLAQGFTVPAEYLQSDFRTRSKPSLIDHRQPTSIPAFDAFALRLGWAWELNLPLMVEGRTQAAVTLYRGADRPFTEQDAHLAEALGQQMALAMQVARISERQRDAEVRRERAERLTRTNEVLQRLTDSVQGVAQLDEVIPNALETIADVFGASCAQFFEYCEDGLVRLRWWFEDGAARRPADVLAAKDSRYAMVALLADGFTVPDDYLGQAHTERTRASILDHSRGTSVPEFDRFAVGIGWTYEINVPLRAAGQYLGAVNLYRDETPFALEDAMLAEALAQPLALTAQAARVAADGLARSVEVAVAREKEAAARERAEQLAQANEVLRRSMERIVTRSGTASHVDAFLVEAVQAVGATGGAVFLRVAGSESAFRAVAWYDDGHLWSEVEMQAEPFASRLFEWTHADAAGEFAAMARGESQTVRIDELKHTLPQAHAYHSAHGQRMSWSVALMLHGRALGFARFAFAQERVLGNGVRETVVALAQQYTLTLELTRLAEEARDAAVAREQEQAAARRTEQLEVASRALQATIDELADLDRLESFLPRALRIAADAFGSRSCAFYELDDAGTIRLRHACWRGLLLSGPDWPGTSPEQAEFLQVLYGGFKVPVDHLGVDPLRRNVSVVLDHRRANTWPPGHAFARSMGWELELNVPLMVAGVARGALLIYRGADMPFRDDEVSLAESLGKQLAVAMQSIRIAEREREAVLALEREQAASARVEELTRANDALRNTVAAIEDLADLDAFTNVVLVEAMRQSHAHDGVVMRYVEKDHTLQLVHLAALEGGKVVSQPIPPSLSAPIAADVTQAWQLMLEARSPLIFDVEIDAHQFWPGTAQWHAERGNAVVVVAPMLRGLRPAGYFGLAFDAEHRPTQARVEMIRALTQQATLAFELTRLSDEAKVATLAQERNRVAGEIHDSLAQSFAGVALQLETAEDAMQAGEHESALVSVSRARDLARFGLAEARRSVMTLRPSATLALGLEAALRALCSRSQVEGLLQCSLTIEGECVLLGGEIDLSLFRIAQEAVSNAVRHAAASRIEVRLRYLHDGVGLQVIDDGRGIQPGAEGGQGLATMAERAARLGGHCSVGPAAEAGTRLSIWVPYAARAGP